MYDQCVYVLYFQVADAVHGVLYVLSHPKLTTVVEPSPYQLTVYLVMEQSVTTAAVWHCFTAAVWHSFTVVVWCSCVLLVLCVASTVSRRSLHVCVASTVSQRSLCVCCWYCVCVAGRSLPALSTECSVGISILNRTGCDSTRVLHRCLPI